MEKDKSWQAFRDDWREGPALRKAESVSSAGRASPSYSPADVWSVWSKDFVSRISHSREVESVVALGSVLAINLHDEKSGKSRIGIALDDTSG